MLRALTAAIVALTMALVVTTEAAEENAAGGPLKITYNMPRDAELSMGVFDKDGQLLRHIAKADFRHAGANAEYWDGRDQYGKPIPAGEYLVKALYHDPISTEYALTLGNPGTPPWPTPDGKGDWLSDEANPQAAATDGKWVYLAAPGSEYGWSVIALDEKGQRQWGMNAIIFARCVSLALDGDNLYVLYSTVTKGEKNPTGTAILLCLDKRTGNAANFTKSNPRLRIADFPYIAPTVGLWELRSNKSYEPGVYGGQPRYYEANFGGPTHALGMAVASGTVYVSMHPDNKLSAYDAKTAAPVPDKDIPLEKPVGLYALSDDALLAVSAGKVVKIDLKTKKSTPIVVSDLSAPHGVTVDKKGEIYVSDWKDSFQVKVFSPSGKFLRAIGKPGGRPWVGKWENDGMLVPRGIAVTDEGKLWVAEDDECPKRVSVWNADNGQFVRDYIGPIPYGGGSIFWIDAADPTIGHTMNTRFKLDWEKKTYTPQAIEWRRMSRDQPFAMNGHSTFSANNLRVIKRNGKEYVGVARYGRLYVILMRKGEGYVPVAAFGTLHRNLTDDGSGWAQAHTDAGVERLKNYWPDFFKGHAGDNFAWSDRNADGLVQSDEMTWVKTLWRSDMYVEGRQPECLNAWGQTMSSDWRFYFSGICKDKGVLFSLDPSGWTDAGVPLYDINQAKTRVVRPLDLGFDGLYAANDGRVYATGYAMMWQQVNNKFTDPRPDALTCMDRDGKLLWTINSVTKQKIDDVMASVVPGEYKLPGLGDVICTWQWWGNFRAYFIGSDGLYVGTTLDEDRNGPSGMWGESYRFTYQAPDGTPYIVNGGNNGHHILRIRGLEKGGRFETKITLSEADAQLAAAAPTDDAVSVKSAEKPVLSVRWLEKSPAIDGSLSDWNMGYAATLDDKEGKTASIALGRDADTLYLAYHVKDNTPLLNKGSDWQQLFITGDCVDLMLAGNSSADPNRPAAVAGDLRLLLGAFQNDPIAVLYRPVAPRAGANRMQLMAAQFDRIERLEDAKVALRRGDGFYEIEAAVPLKTLGIASDQRKILEGDVGIIYSDVTGNSRVKRVYYYNQKTQRVSDLTTEATLQPAEWGVIRFPMGLNLVKNSGFEDTPAQKPQEGWVLNPAKNGCESQLAGDLTRSGKQALRLNHLPDSAADAKATRTAAALQQVPVEGGKKYSLRFWYRTSGFRLGTGGRGEAYIPGTGALHVRIRWIGKDLDAPDISTGMAIWTGKWSDPATQNVMEAKKDSNGWVECYDERVPAFWAPRPYSAPVGATHAMICFDLNVSDPDDAPSVIIDDVEFVEEPAE